MHETYYIKITGSEGCTYKFRMSAPAVVRPAKVTLKKVAAVKGAIKVQYKKAKRASKYQIAVKKKGASKWKYYTSKGLSKKITKLTKKKKYTVKVRGIRTVNNKKYYGKWSKTKTVTVK